MNLKELASKSGISEKTITDLLPKIGVNVKETDFNDKHLAMLERIKTIKESLPETTDPVERVRLAVQQFNEELSAKAIAVVKKGHLTSSVVETDEYVPPNVVEDLTDLADELVAANLRDTAKEFVSGAVSHAYAISESMPVDAADQGAATMERIMMEKRLQKMSDPAFVKETHDFFLEAKQNAQAAREVKTNP
jgi:hypothetical protein